MPMLSDIPRIRHTYAGQCGRIWYMQEESKAVHTHTVTFGVVPVRS
jgi:hypothetical protein